MRKIGAIILLSTLLLFPQGASARLAYDWYIKDFQTEIIVNRDSSLSITEMIIADAADLPGKHGIFRILPLKASNIDGGTRMTPIELIGITDFAGRPHKYKTIKDNMNDTVIWKIGDPNVTVTGENEYKIVYNVYNAVYDDLLHWNILGNFWDLEIDAFKARVIFPDNITKDEIRFDYFTGHLGSKRKDASYRWIDDNTLEVTSDKSLTEREGITLQVFFEEGNFIPHKFSFSDLYLKYFYLFIPLIAFAVSFRLWQLHGKDYKLKKPVLTEFLRPREIDLIEADMFMNNGTMTSRSVAALIVDMAVKGAIKIEEMDKKLVIIPYKEVVLQKLERKESLTEIEKMVFDKLFEKGDEVDLTSLRSTLPKFFNSVRKKAKESLVSKNLFYEKGFNLQGKMTIALGLFSLIGFISILVWMSLMLVLSLIATFVILLVFTFIMPKRTKEGVDLYLYLEGLKRYLSVAEKERQAFYEEENIFEKLLPYAIIFGVTHKWAKKMEVIYGQDYFKGYNPGWWSGSSGFSDFDSFSRNIETLSNQIASNSSSSGGSGGSGGGGGGGGGGGW